ncbi:MAG: hypothetical protein ACPGJV_03035 [Bacteriovoracaceae bacterium]
MMKNFILCISFLIVTGCTLNPSTQNPDVVIGDNVIDRPVREFGALPTDLKNLYPFINGKTLVSVYESAKGDQWKRFTVLNIARFKVKEKLTAEEKQNFQTLFNMAIKDDFEWNQTIGVWGLGASGSMDDMRTLISMLDHSNPIIVDESLLALEILFDREQTVEPTRAPASKEDDVVTLHDVNYWKNLKL